MHWILIWDGNEHDLFDLTLGEFDEAARTIRKSWVALDPTNPLDAIALLVAFINRREDLTEDQYRAIFEGKRAVIVGVNHDAVMQNGVLAQTVRVTLELQERPPEPVEVT